MPEDERFHSLIGFILLHPLVITFILFSSSYPINYSIPTSYWFIILGSFILSAIFFLIERWLKRKTLLYSIFIADIPLIAVIIHYTGGLNSMFSLLYALLIIISAIYLFRNGAYIISLLSVFSLLALFIFESKFSNYPINYILHRFYLFALLFLFTAILSGNLSERYTIKSEEYKKLKLTTEEIVKNLPSGIITIDGAGKIIYTNLSDEIIQTRVHLYLARFLKNPKEIPWTNELRIKNKFYLLSCTVIGNSQGALGILQDLTEIKKLEEKARISKQTKILAELGGSLAHEIRNPLSSIRGALEVIKKSHPPNSDVPFIEMALKESIRLNEIVTDFLQFAQFIPKKTSRIKVNDCISEAILEIENYITEKRLKIIRDGEDFFCQADLDRLKSGITNILTNACEASRPGQSIFIRVGRDNKFGWIEITDQGTGIYKKDLKKIFVPFYTTKKGGTGLGLSIAQKIIEAHNGRIEVYSKIRKGTTFKIILPLS
uniref:histidine kinase n=1 Tax=candidate division WOR-3 bacterium TaxID=2052148 RepID=A0A7C4TES7_UNCW3